MANTHIVSSYGVELERLAADVLRLGGLAESMIADACSSLVRGDVALAEATASRDDLLDRLEIEIERRIIRLLALRQPMASDLRSVIAALKLSNELERIGDLSKNIAKRAPELEGFSTEAVFNAIALMGRAVSEQLHAVLDAYSSANASEALRVWVRDEDIDQHYNSLFRETLAHMMEDPSLITAGAHIMFIAKNLERIGDHCTNIAEVVHYQVTGDPLSSMARPKAPLLDG